MEFCLLNESLAVVGYLEHIVSARVTRRFFAPGEITVLTSHAPSLPSSARYIYEAKHGVCAVIEKLEHTEDGGGRISGRTAECLLERQLIKREGYYTGSVAGAVRLVLQLYALAGGTFPTLQIGSTDHLPGNERLRLEWTSVSEWLYRNLARYGASFCLTIADGTSDTDKFTFNTVIGRDLTPTEESAGVIIREEDGSLENARFSVDESGYANVLCVIGGDGRYASLPTDDAPSGLDRRETFLEAWDILPTAYDSDEAYFEALRERGEGRLSEYREAISFTGEVTGGNFHRYGTDYELGDICALELASGTQLSLRVCSVTYTLEDGAELIRVGFGGDISSSAVQSIAN